MNFGGIGMKIMNLQLFGWGDVGAEANKSSGTTSDLVKLEGKTRLRLLPEVAQSGPRSMWFYTISTPADDYRTWLAPEKSQDFFAKNRNVFGVKATHAGLVYDYESQSIKILEAGNQIWEGIKDLVEAGKDLSNRDIMITKKGTGRSTTYSVVDCDPTPAPSGLDTMERPDMDARYTPATWEEVKEDLIQLGFTNPDEIFQTRPIKYEDALAFKVPFGKHKGLTLKQLVSTDAKYLSFLATKVDRVDVKNYARVVSNTIMGTGYNVDGATPTMEELTFVPPTKDGVSDQPQQEEGPAQEQDLPREQDPAPKQEPKQEETPAPNPQSSTTNRQGIIDSINKAFETNPEYNDFMKIINAMKEATAPNPKTSLDEFSMAELTKLYNIVAK